MPPNGNSVRVSRVGVHTHTLSDCSLNIKENGCKIAGFLTVFASTLSIFTLATITLERLFAINYAIQLDRRLKLSIAIRAMICGWIYAIVMATLPLVGVNSYTKTSICLPMEHNTIADKVYLVALLSINGIAFILITASYVIVG